MDLKNASMLSAPLKAENVARMLSTPDALINRYWQEVRHTAPITGLPYENPDKGNWKTCSIDHIKTSAVAVCLCLYLGVDPPDRKPKPNDCSKIEAWIDPTGMTSTKAMDKIAKNIQKQYDSWQPRTKTSKYKAVCDPTIRDVSQLCKGLRQSSKDSRVLFHYNGHGVPRPTSNGEIWVFNDAHTQYIPLSVLDLQGFLGTPAAYIWDCDSAATIVKAFDSYAGDQENNWIVDVAEYQEMGEALPPLTSGMEFHEQAKALNFPRKKPTFKADCIHLAACRANESLPIDPEMPADLFTASLTTPIHTSILWHRVKSGRAGNMKEIINEIPGHLNDRRTILGELNWIFTTITDTIAWNTLERVVFDKLFRQDTLLASLFRAFLFAERIMAKYGNNVVSSPAIPSSAEHPLWASWDRTLDLAVDNLNALRTGESMLVFSLNREAFCRSHVSHLNPLLDLSSQFKGEDGGSQYSSFFVEQLTAFEVCLDYGVQREMPPAQLPVILQVLLSRIHRVRAVGLLARFLDHGQWAVNYALSIGMFPFITKMLHLDLQEMKMSLTFVWAKILSVDSTIKEVLFSVPSPERDIPYHQLGTDRSRRDLRYLYFMYLFNDPQLLPRQKIVPAFVLATLFADDYTPAQECLTERGYLNSCMETLQQQSETKYTCSLLKLWVLIGMGRLWADYDKARWNAIRLSAYKMVMKELEDSSAEVRAGAVYALGRLVKNRADTNEHARVIAQEIMDELSAKVARDGATIVREEVIVAFQYVVIETAASLASLHRRLTEQARKQMSTPREEETIGGEALARATPTMRLPLSRRRKQASDSDAALEEAASRYSASSPFCRVDFAYREETRRIVAILESKIVSHEHERTWLTVLRLSLDPVEKVARMAQNLVKYISDTAEHRRSCLVVSPPPLSVSSPCPPAPDEDVVEAMEESPAADTGVHFIVGSPMTDSTCEEWPLPQAAVLSTPLASPRPSTPLTSSLAPPSSRTRNLSLKVHSYPRKRVMNQKEIIGPRSKKAIEQAEKEKARQSRAGALQPVLVETQFIPWCYKRFVHPIRNIIMNEREWREAEGGKAGRGEEKDRDGVLTLANANDWAIHREEGMRQLAEREFNGCYDRMESIGRWSTLRRSETRRLRAAAFSLLRPFLYVTDGERIEVLSFDSAGKATPLSSWPFHGGNPFVTDRLSYLGVINPLTTEMLISGSSNGMVRVWNCSLNPHSHEMGEETSLVTAAFPLTDQARIRPEGWKSDVTLYDWNQPSGRLLCTGNVKVCRVWDAHAEKTAVDLHTGRRGAVLAMSGELDRTSLVALGYNDGRVHLHDVREAGTTKVLSLDFHTRPIVGVALRAERDGSRCLLSAICTEGYLRVWEPRMYRKPLVETAVQEEQGCGEGNATSMVMHRSSQMLATSLSNHTIRLFDISGREMGTLRPGPLLSPPVMAFHPYRPLLAVGHGAEGESLVSTFGPADFFKGHDKKPFRKYY